MQDYWRRTGCAEWIIATVIPSSLHLIILLYYYQLGPTVTFIWSCFHLPKNTFVDICWYHIDIKHVSQHAYRNKFCFSLRSGSILYVYILFQIKLQTSDLDKKTYQNFISANEGGILKLFFLTQRTKKNGQFKINMCFRLACKRARSSWPYLYTNTVFHF